jgi:hypothetical protein
VLLAGDAAEWIGQVGRLSAREGADHLNTVSTKDTTLSVVAAKITLG